MKFEDMDKLLRNAHIGIACAAVLLIAGSWPAHKSETAMSVLGLAAIVVSLGVFFVLSMREDGTRHGEDPSDRHHP